MREGSIGAARLRRGWPAAVGLIALFWASSVVAQSFDDAISVSLVEVPVQVLVKGEPVPGLTTQDFELWVDGERREIVGFREIVLGGSGSSRGPSGSEASGASTPGERHLLLLFDLAFSPFRDLERALAGARVMVDEQLSDADRLGVGVYSLGQGARLLLPFTGDRQAMGLGLDVVEAGLGSAPEAVEAGLVALDQRLRGGVARSLEEILGTAGARAVRKAGLGRVGVQRGGSGQQRADGDGSLYAAAASGGGSASGGFGSSEAMELFLEAEVDSIASRVSGFNSGLGALVRDLEGVPSPKYLVLLSPGFESGFLIDGQVSRQFGLLCKSLVQAGWTVQAVDTSGTGSRGPGQDALMALADETGGELFTNSNRVEKATARLLERTRILYQLAFDRGGIAEDGRRRPIEVRLKRPDLDDARIVARPWFYPPSAGDAAELAAAQDRLQRLLGDEVVGDLSATVLAVTLPSSEESARVPVVVEVPGPDLLTGLKGERLQIEARIFALGASGELMDQITEELTLDLERAGETLRRAGLKLYGDLELPPGEYRLRVQVYSPETGREHLSTTPLAVTAVQAGPRLARPVFIDESGEWLLARQRAAAPAAAYPFTVGEQPLVPAAHPAIAGDDALRFLLLVGEVAAETMSAQARVVNDAGQEVAGGRLVSLQRAPAADDGLSRLVGEYRLADLPPGDYSLQVRVVNRESGRAAVSAAAFAVR